MHQGTLKVLRHGSHSFTCKQHHACLSFVNIHQMSPPQQLRQHTSNCSSILIYRPGKDDRLSWPSWLTYSGWLTHISGHPSPTKPRNHAFGLALPDFAHSTIRKVHALVKIIQQSSDCESLFSLCSTITAKHHQLFYRMQSAVEVPVFWRRQSVFFVCV